MAVQQLYAAPKAQRPALQRIRRWSLPFEIVFAAIAIMFALLSVLVIAATLAPDLVGMHVRIGPQGGELSFDNHADYPANSIDVSEAPLGAQLVGFLVLTVVMGTRIAAFYCLHRLFGAYRRGLVFAETSIRWMRRAGFLSVAASLAPLAFQPLVHAAGLRDERWFHAQGVAFLLVGAALFVLANIIALGRDIEKEGEGYV